MKHVLLIALAAALTSCVQRPMTHAQWRAEQAKRARINAVKSEATEMSKTSVVITKEEQAQSGKR